MKQMEKAQMLHVLDEYSDMLKRIYGDACPKHTYACKDVMCRMVHRLLKEIQETADILRYGSPEEQRMMALVLAHNKIIELLMADLQSYTKDEGINPALMAETTSSKGA